MSIPNPLISTLLLGTIQPVPQSSGQAPVSAAGANVLSPGNKVQVVFGDNGNPQPWHQSTFLIGIIIATAPTSPHSVPPPDPLTLFAPSQGCTVAGGSGYGAPADGSNPLVFLSSGPADFIYQVNSGVSAGSGVTQYYHRFMGYSASVGVWSLDSAFNVSL